MQRAYIDALYNLIKSNSNVMSIVADNGTDYDWLFQRDFPDNFLNVGIAEQNMVAMAAGLSDAGIIPFISTSGAFMVYRSYEFIRDDVCLGKRNVKMFASGSGISISNLGPTHHATEDIALLRTLPGLTVLSPSTPSEMSEAVNKAYAIHGPVYIRGGMTGEKEIKPLEYLDGGVACDIRGKDIVICTTGSILELACDVAIKMKARGYDVGLYHFTRLKPFNYNALSDITKGTKLVVSMEDHQKFGGLSSIISDSFTDYGISIPIVKIGYDGFVAGYGSQNELREMNFLSADEILNKVTLEVKKYESL